MFLKNIFAFFKLFPIKSNKIVAVSYCGRGFKDKPLYICNELKKRNQSLDIVVLVDKKTIVNDFRNVSYFSFKTLYELATAKIWIDNCRKPSWISKRKEQYYIQTWHGIDGAILKCVEKDAPFLPQKYIEDAKKDSINANLFISESKYMSKRYRESFWYDGEIIEGQVINKNYYDYQYYYKKVCKELKITEKTKIVLYAPTFRNNCKLDIFNLDYKKIKTTLQKKFGGEWVILTRMHPNFYNMSTMLDNKSEFIDVTRYEDVYELISASEILITDYSACQFFALKMNKKIILYIPDYEEYTKKDRKLYFDINELPYPKAKTVDELCKIIMSNINSVQNNKNRKTFINGIGYVDKIIVDEVSEKILKNTI